MIANRATILHHALFVAISLFHLQGYATTEAKREPNCQFTGIEASTTNLQPGDLVSLCLKISNQTSQEQKVQLQLHLPKEWQLLDQETSLTIIIAGEKNEMVIFGIAPSPLTPSGNYCIDCELWEEDELVDRSQLNFFVEQRQELQFIAANQPSYCTAATTYSLRYSVVNNGNCSLPLLVELRVSPDGDCTSSPTSFTLEAGATQELTLTLHFPRRSAPHFIFVNLLNAKSGERLYTTSFPLEVIDGTTQRDDLWRRLPGWYALSYLHDRHLQYVAGEIHLAGPLTNSHWLNLHGRLPSDDRCSLYGMERKFHLSVTSPQSFMILGDGLYFLSPLTERHLSAFGLGWSQDDGFWQSVLYHARFPRQTLHHAETGAMVGFRPTEGTMMSLNFLHKNRQHCHDSSSILSLKFDWCTPCSRFMVEGGANLQGRGKVHDAVGYTFLWDNRFWKTGWFHFEQTHAAPRFYGYVHNMDSLAAAIDIPLPRNIRIGYSFNQWYRDHKQLSSCDQFHNRFQRRHEAHIAYRSPSNWSVTLDGHTLRAQEPLHHNQSRKKCTADFYQQWLGGSLFSKRGMMSITASGHWGKNHDYRCHTTHSPLYRYHLYLRAQPLIPLETVVDLESGTIDPFDKRRWRNQIGIGMNYCAWNGFLELFARYAARTRHCSSSRHYLLRFHRALINDHHFQVKADYHQAQSATHASHWTAVIEYAIPLSIPLVRREDCGMIAGRLLTPAEITPANIILRIGERRVITDHSGSFCVTLPPGRYPVMAEMAFVDGSFIEEQWVTVRAGTTTPLRLYPLHYSDLRVDLSLFDLPEEYEAALLAMKQLQEGGEALKLLRCVGGCAKVALHLLDRLRGYRLTMMTDEKGEALFSSLPRGSYRLFVDEMTIPPTHEVTQRYIDIEVGSREKRGIMIPIFPKGL